MRTGRPWPRGVSGNPGGRPKGLARRNLDTGGRLFGVREVCFFEASTALSTVVVSPLDNGRPSPTASRTARSISRFDMRAVSMPRRSRPGAPADLKETIRHRPRTTGRHAGWQRSRWCSWCAPAASCATAQRGCWRRENGFSSSGCGRTVRLRAGVWPRLWPEGSRPGSSRQQT
jgi:hypothetical protein